MSSFVTITIDGGAASGKSTAARTLADKWNLLHVDTGSHYRLLSYGILEQKVDIHNAQSIAAFIDQLHLDTEIIGNNSYISWKGATPNNTDIRNQAINQIVSPVAAIAEIRKVLKHYQRSQVQIARDHKFAGLIMEGRDIGSIILPDADHRFFFHASPEARQRRREAEGITDSIALRDKIDSERKVAPLVCPEGAIKVDTGDISREEVISAVEQHIGPWKQS